MQHLAGTQCGCLGHRRAHFVFQLRQPREQRGVERKLPASSPRREIDPAVKLAAGDFRGDLLAQTRLERAQFLGNPELDVEKAVVDALQLDKQGTLRNFTQQRRITGHALNHIYPFKKRRANALALHYGLTPRK